MLLLEGLLAVGLWTLVQAQMWMRPSESKNLSTQLASPRPSAVNISMQPGYAPYLNALTFKGESPCEILQHSSFVAPEMNLTPLPLQ